MGKSCETKPNLHGQVSTSVQTCAENVQPRTNVETESSLATGSDVEVAATAVAPLYSCFTSRQKWFIVFMSSWGSFFSPLAANIYLSALNVLARDLRVDSSKINLTVTSYMIFQGLAPMFIGQFADKAGRRPAWLLCFVPFILANIGLALQRNYAALLILRCLQAVGSSPTIALGSGTVADIATAAERGKYMGIVQAGSLLGPSLAPLIGGLLAQFLGWPSIFWFLAIFGTVFAIVFAIAFPETGRSVVGDGSLIPPLKNWSLLLYLQRRKGAISLEGSVPKEQSLPIKSKAVTSHSTKSRMTSWFALPEALTMISYKDMAILLLYNSLVYTAYMVIAASNPYIFRQIYVFNELQIGLSYLPYGLGTCIATWMWGVLIDRNFRRLARIHNIPYDRKRAMEMTDFPLEKCRLEVVLPLIYSGALIILAYGWAVHFNAPLAPVLVLQFFVGLLVAGAFNLINIMIVDLFPDKPSTATACNNFVRCLVGAGGVAVIIDMLDAMGRGWAFTLVSLIMVSFSPMAWLIYFKGSKWRAQRCTRSEKRESERSGAHKLPASHNAEDAAVK